MLLLLPLRTPGVSSTSVNCILLRLLSGEGEHTSTPLCSGHFSLTPGANLVTFLCLGAAAAILSLVQVSLACLAAVSRVARWRVAASGTVNTATHPATNTVRVLTSEAEGDEIFFINN